MKYQDFSRFKVPSSFRGRPLWYIQLWWLVQSLLFHPTPQFMYSWRRFLLRLFGAKIGKNVLIRSSVIVTYPWKVSIGDYSWIGDETILYSLGEIHIGYHTSISQRCFISTGAHDYKSLAFDIFSKPITIGNESWVANSVVISPGVTIGDGTVVGACSLVTKDLPSGMVCYGQPARPIHPRVVTN